MKKSVFVLIAALFAGCSSKPAEPPAPATIPVTSKSPEAIGHFQKGESLFNNIRMTEAAEEFRQALALDADFQLARAYHGAVTPGPDGLKEIEAAAAAAASLPEAERVLIQSIAANRRGDVVETHAALARLIELAPGDWRGHYLLGQQLLGEQKYGEAVQALTRATQINTSFGGAQNMLGYAALRQGDTDGAVKAFTEYVRLQPQEPNPQDSLGEALLGAGRFPEAEAAFKKALELSPEFWNAHEGMAMTKLYAGDRTGASQAFAAAKAAATRPIDKIGIDQEMATVAAAQGRTAEALRLIEAAGKTEGAQPSDVASLPLNRAMVLIAAGRAREALAPIEAAEKAADAGQFPAGMSRGLRRGALRLRVMADAMLADAAGAAKTAAALDQDAASRPDDVNAQSAMHFGQGQLALAKKDLAAARQHFGQCSSEDEICQWQGVVAAEKAGDKAGAAALRERLLKVYVRDASHFFIRSRLTPAQKG